jgi:hypothetical protein
MSEMIPSGFRARDLAVSLQAKKSMVVESALYRPRDRTGEKQGRGKNEDGGKTRGKTGTTGKNRDGEKQGHRGKTGT